MILRSLNLVHSPWSSSPCGVLCYYSSPCGFRIRNRQVCWGDIVLLLPHSPLSISLILTLEKRCKGFRGSNTVPAQQNSSLSTLSSEKLMRAGGVAQVVECLPSKREALSSNCRTAKNQTKLNQKRKPEKLMMVAGFSAQRRHLICLLTGDLTLYSTSHGPQLWSGREESEIIRGTTENRMRNSCKRRIRVIIKLV
jgi:hypothetical protein